MRITDEQMVSRIKDELTRNGLEANSSVIDIIIKNYNHIHKLELLNGNSFEMSGIGVVNPSWRKVSKAFTDIPYTSKLSIDLNPELKNEMNRKLATDPNYRNSVGASEL